MADWKSLIDPKLKAEFERQGPDPRAAQRNRDRFIKSLDTAARQFGSTEPTKGKKMWKAANNVVEFSPKSGNGPVLLNGSETHYIPSERFPAFLEALKQSVSAGELDDALEASAGAEGASSGEKKPRKERKLGDQSKANIKLGGYRRGGMSDKDAKARLKEEGFSDEIIAAAFARKK